MASCGPRSGDTLFKLHIADPIPSSVKNLEGTEKTGSGLAGNWAVITCDIDPKDAKALIMKLGYPKYIPEDKGPEKGLLEGCRNLNIEPDEIFLKDNSTLKWILIFNKEKTKLYYTYIKI